MTGPVLTAAERAAHWEWCRTYIDREVIWRTDAEHPPIPAKAKGKTYVWQFYSRRATLNPQFAHRLGLMFWDHFLPAWERRPFQLGICYPSGSPIGAAIANVGLSLGVQVNAFGIRREVKSFGIDNWFDGVDNGHPVLLVDDVAASAPFLRNAAVRVQQKLRLPLHHQYFAVVAKVGRTFSKAAQHTENLLDNELVALFNINNFCTTATQYESRYGEKPKWSGPVA